MENGCTKPLNCKLETGEIAVVKTFNNLQSNIVLVNEIISYEIALLLGLPVPDSGICLIDDETNGIEILDDITQKGKGFYSKRINKATILNSNKMVDLIENKKDILKLIIFDHLVYNSDRNAGNIILKFQKQNLLLNVIDHTHVFNKQCLWNKYELIRCREEKDFLDTKILTNNSYLYNMFFQKIPIKLEDLLEISAKYKELINKNILKEIIDKIPKEWELKKEDSEELIEYLLYRLNNLDEMCSIIMKFRGGGI